MHDIFNRFKKEDAFVGYNSDTKAAVVLQACTQFQMSKNTPGKEEIQKVHCIARSIVMK